MRRIVSVLLVVLLVLRGLLGDAMAMGMPMGMATMPTHSAAAHAASPADAPAQDGAHTAPDAGHCATTPAADTGDCGSGHTPCAACAICHTPMHPPVNVGLGSPDAGLAAPAQARIDFVSAALTLAVKPPIA